MWSNGQRCQRVSTGIIVLGVLKLGGDCWVGVDPSEGVWDFSDRGARGQFYWGGQKTRFFAFVSPSKGKFLIWGSDPPSDLHLCFQTISLDLRSTSCIDDVGVFEPENFDKAKCLSGVELNYAAILNRVLPDEIRITGWAPCGREFSARFDCTSRMYHYYVSRAGLDIKVLH